MRALLAVLLIAPLALATEVIDGVNPPNPAKFAWNAGTKTATLTVDLNEGIRITGAGVTLEGAGHTVSSGGLDNWGIRIDAGLSHVTIREVTVTGFPSGGIVFAGANEDCVAEDCVATGNSTGIVMQGEPLRGVVRRNRADDNLYAGIHMGGYSCTECTIEDNTVAGNAIFGMRIDAAQQCVVRRNTATGNSPVATSGGGIAFLGTSMGCSVEDNATNDNNGGMGIDGDDNLVQRNSSERNRYGGIQVRGDRNRILDNTTADNQTGFSLRGDELLIEGNEDTRSDPAEGGISLFGVSNSVVRCNTVRDSGFNGFALGEPTSTGNLFEGNLAAGCTEGYRLGASDVVVRNNRSENNNSDGFRIYGTNYVLEHNTAIGNGGAGIATWAPAANGNLYDGNTLENNGGGMTLGGGAMARGNALAGSTSWGIRIYSGGCTAEGNIVTGSGTYGLDFVAGAGANTIRGNTITDSGAAGAHFSSQAGTDGNVLYDNAFRNTVNVILGGVLVQQWNVAATPGPNIVGGPSIGGNYWATPTGTGWSETCTDANGDGFCDQAYVIDANNVDALPLVLNTPPSCNPSGAGVYELGSAIVLGGTVADNEGDLLTYQWREGATVLSSGTAQATPGGEPVALPDFVVALGLGTHGLQLVVDDGHILDPVVCDVVVEVIDTTAPTLTPESDCSMLWPPNHQMVSCTIEANASDNDGLPPHLDVTVASNEPDDGLGDGDTADDIQNLTVDQATGAITVELRAERGGVGSGRVYTVAITATDGEGNSSMTSLTILVPRSKGQGGN